MRKPFDLLIVGAGLFGATCAHELTRRGFRCLVLDKRSHIGGNCYTEERDGINLHRFGPHIFHTSNRTIWDWINQFATFNTYRHHAKVNYHGRIFSFPINLFTLHQLWGVSTPGEARARLEQAQIKSGITESAEDWMLSQVGPEIYEIFFKGYTRKQWGVSASELPAAIFKRLPIRLTHDDNYFNDLYQGIPVGGYTSIFAKLLANIEVRLDAEYFDEQPRFDAMAGRVLYTGPLDRFFGYRFGKLAYRSIRFESERLEIPDYQGVSMMHYTAEEIPFTRIVEHKHFEFGRQPVTWITREFPLAAGTGHEPMYPIADDQNRDLFSQYEKLSRTAPFRNYHFGGRLAEYRYYDMHQVIGAAFATVKTIEHELLAAT